MGIFMSVHACEYVCMSRCANMCTCVYISACEYVNLWCMYACVCMCVVVCVCMCVQICGVCACLCVFGLFLPSLLQACGQELFCCFFFNVSFHQPEKFLAQDKESINTYCMKGNVIIC